MDKVVFMENRIIIGTNNYEYSQVKRARYIVGIYMDAIKIYLSDRNIKVKRRSNEFGDAFFFLRLNHIIIENMKQMTVVDFYVSKERFMKYHDEIISWNKPYIQDLKNEYEDLGFEMLVDDYQTKKVKSHECRISSVLELNNDDGFFACIALIVIKKVNGKILYAKNSNNEYIYTIYPYAIQSLNGNLHFEIYIGDLHYKQAQSVFKKHIKNPENIFYVEQFIIPNCKESIKGR